MQNSFRDGTLRPAVHSFFNEELDVSRAFLLAHLRSSPEDPLAHAIAAAVEFYGAVIGWILAGGAASVGTYGGRGRMELEETRCESIQASLRLAERFANSALPDDGWADLAIFARCIAESIRRDWSAVVLNRWADSLSHAQEANLLGRKLLKANPAAHDAYCIFGSSEYLISRVPATMRPFAKIPGVTGSRAKAIQFYEVTSRTGRYYKEFARCMLVALYTEEGRHKEALRTLSGLADEFPKNAAVAAALRASTDHDKAIDRTTSRSF
jgi:tetratricopeptide (TPR) repeat protein